ncbi:MAG: methionyl-tRNA formyltransferase [Verrucomicrobiaceae bacterium]
MRIVFIGTGDIGLPTLESLIASRDHELVAIVTQPDKPVGRDQKLTPPAVKVRAMEAGVPVLQPKRIRDALDELSPLSADVFVVIAYGQILSRAVLDVPCVACLNIHASLLPLYRGAAPIQAAIRASDLETGITIMWMDEGLDTGDILLQEKLLISASETGGSLHDRLAAQAPNALQHALLLLSEGKAPHIPQENASATLTRKLEREHGRLDWKQSATELKRIIRAYHPWPGTFCLLKSTDGKSMQLKVHQASVVEDAAACPIGGTVISTEGRLLVSCGSGVLELIEVQLEGRKRMSAAEFLRGHPQEPGTVLL